jgi:hypothetical protein
MDSREYWQMLYALHTVKHGQLWGRQLGLQYLLQPSLVSQGVGTFTDGLFAVTSNGWVNTGTIIGVAGSGADFPAAAENTWALAADKGTPNHFAIDTAGDLLNSPAIFGDPTHMAAVADLIDALDLPAFLDADFYFRFADGNNETASGIGFVEDGGSAAVANDHFGCFFIDGTSFKLRSGAATSAAILAKDTAWHKGRIRINRLTQLVEGWVDTLNVPAMGSVALEADELPVSFGAGVLTSTGANFINWGPTRIRYGWANR